ncbi:sphingomyelin phosphodiesterase-like [Elysia marginata]|uniref:Sphingomyelin phosphodiesterase-like n=1 Tax=Elysia marginata TaxID=1093978 RepID=A0AAV4IL66_9GAST|nr:sphingomyelin phosphodiesterase-like [Elysia marginata]
MMKISLGVWTSLISIFFLISLTPCSVDSLGVNFDQISDLSNVKFEDFIRSRPNDGSREENEWRADEKMLAYLQRQQRKSEDKIIPALTCDACHVLVKVARDLVRSGKTQKFVVDVITDICIFFHIQDKHVCRMITHEYEEEIFYLARYLSVEAWQACSIVLGLPCHGHYYPGENWTVSFPHTPKPEPRPPTPPQPSSPRLKVLHLTDIHLDLQYREGSRVDCDEPICCRDPQWDLFGK